MATLDWTAVAVIGGVATVGFALLSYWVSAWMTKRDVMGQVRSRRKEQQPKPAKE